LAWKFPKITNTCRALFLSGSEECVEESDVKLLGFGEVVLESRIGSVGRLPETVLCALDVDMCTPCSADRGWATPGDGNLVLLGRGIRENRSKIYSISDAIFSLLLVSLLDVHISGSEYADEGSIEVLAEGGRLELATGKACRQSRLERWDCAVDVVG